MKELIIGLTIIGALFYIIHLVMEYKAKNFIYEKHNNFLTLFMMISMHLFSFIFKKNESYSQYINIIIIISILGGYIAFQKNRIYFFRGIDKKLIKENKSKIIQYIEDYKSNYTYGKADITFANNKLVFEKVSKQQAEECLSIIGNLLDENRKKYTFKDYLIYLIKGHLLPTVITLLAILIFFKILAYSPY